MKNRILLISLLFAALLTTTSCTKTWLCTCSATVIAAPGGNVGSTYTVTSTDTPTAQADCNSDCSGYLNNPAYTHATATVKGQ